MLNQSVALINEYFEKEKIHLELSNKSGALLFKPSKKNNKPNFDYPNIYFI